MEGHTLILVWVDDIIVASRSMTVISDVKKALEATFHMEDRGRLHWFLGLKIRREESKVTVDQESYIETILKRMDQCNPSRTPADLNLKFQTAKNGDEDVRSLLYLAKQNDIMFTVNILSRELNAPTNQHWMCGERILRYLQGSKCLKLTYTKEASYDLVGGGYEDWFGDVNDRKSTTLLFQAQRMWRSTQLWCREAGHSRFFFIRSRISGHGSRILRSIVSETTSGGFWHPTETSIGADNNWGGQQELQQIVPKNAQEKQTH